MRKNRILYVLWLLAALMLFILANSKGATALLCCSVIAPALCSAAVGLSSAGVNSAVVLGEASFVEIKNTGVVPLTVELELVCKNTLTGRERRMVITKPLPPRSEGKIEFELDSVYCGRLEVSVENMKVYEPLGIYGFKARGKCEGAFVVIQPEQFDCEVLVCENEPDNAESDIYSMERAGNDASETFMIREYVPGDPVRNIHWKLSGKTDDIMVRELGLPVSGNTLLLLDMAYHNEPPSSRAINTLAECFSSIGIALLNAHIGFTAAFMTCEDRLEYFSINSPEDFSAAVDKMLSGTFFKSEAPTEMCFKNDGTRQRFEHIVYLTRNSQASLGALCEGGRVNAVVLARDKAKPEGAYVTQISNKTYKQALALVEI